VGVGRHLAGRTEQRARRADDGRQGRAFRAVLPQPELEDGRIQLLATMLGSLGVQT